MTQYETKDSGERQEFDSGMKRDTEAGKARFDLMIPEGVPYEEQLLTRFALLLSRGAEKYDARNWEKADSDAEIQRARSSAFRHFMQWFTGETDEDHAAATIFNLMVVETISAKVAKIQAEDSLEDVDVRTVPHSDLFPKVTVQHTVKSSQVIPHFTVADDGVITDNHKQHKVYVGLDKPRAVQWVDSWLEQYDRDHSPLRIETNELTVEQSPDYPQPIETIRGLRYMVQADVDRVSTEDLRGL